MDQVLPLHDQYWGTEAAMAEGNPVPRALDGRLVACHIAEQFLEYFDGFSIGSNALTQLTLGLDRDSATVASLLTGLLYKLEAQHRASMRIDWRETGR